MKEQSEKSGFALGKQNYKLLAIGFGIIIIGFLLMIGGATKARMCSMLTKFLVSEESP